MSITVENERPEEYRTVEELIRAAFLNVNVLGCVEHYTAHVLRSHEDFIPELDFVLKLDEKLIASVMYTKSKLIDENGGEKTILTFGPFAVLPGYQRQGFGKNLLEYSLEKAKNLGYEAVVIFGNPENYIARGFKNCKRYNVASEEGVYPVPLLVKELKEGALSEKKWTFKESGAYAFDEKAFEEFDQSFPQCTKEYRPSQELFYIYSGSIMR